PGAERDLGTGELRRPDAVPHLPVDRCRRVRRRGLAELRQLRGARRQRLHRSLFQNSRRHEGRTMRPDRRDPALQCRRRAGVFALGNHAPVRGVLTRVPAGGRRAWGAAFLVVLLGGLVVLQWLTFRPPAGVDADVFAWVGAIWIVLLTITGLGYGRR